MKRYCGRDFTTDELEQIKELIENNPSKHRTDLSRDVCQMLSWYKADGGLKEMSCRVAMLRMQKDGLIQLPPPRRPTIKPSSTIPTLTSATDSKAIICQPVHLLEKLQLHLVIPKNSRLWNEYIQRYHYLGYTRLPGAQLRYFITMNKQILALVGFGAAAWQIASRDKFIGWNSEQRLKGLPLIVNNARFLILPWIQSKNLASKILAMLARRLPNDWYTRYKIQPVLMETFVEKDRFTGTCYKAANWIYVGQTRGWGKLGKPGIQSVPIKDVFLYPLTLNFQAILKNQNSK